MTQIRFTATDQLVTYLLANEPPEHRELLRLREATLRLPMARMQILPEQGHLLAFLVKLVGARRVLELGTFTGYSAMVMALALPEDGKVSTCDLNADAVDLGRPFWKSGQVDHKIDVHLGPASETLATLESASGRPFDLAFIDADKPAYDDYYEACLRLVRPGGLVILDNMFQRGEVADPLIQDGHPAALRALNAKIASDERVDRVILPIADGMTLIRRR